MSTPLSFDDDQLSALWKYAAPLSPSDRDPFLREVAKALRSVPELGPGAIQRTIAEVQRRYIDRAVGCIRSTATKYSRGGGRGRRV